ncbi:MAG TPA: aldo/keto reductase [Bacillota bacterium]|nr:aldo/keto reductase [Bacillota bacterium]
MPWFGLGVYKANEGEEVQLAVRSAIEIGYRSIDTAALYQNEQGVGQAIRDCEIPREQLFITTKVWNTDQGFETTLQAFEESRKKLGLDYIDLYLIHWPVKEKYVETWRALNKLYAEGLVRAIGVSNFQVHHIKDLMQHSEMIPMVNQIELHPRLTQKTLLDYCKEQQIQVEAWSPLMRGNLMANPTLEVIANKYKKSVAQVILRWDLEHQVVTIPKSVNPSRIIENANIFDFQLTHEDIEAIDALNLDQRVGPDPDNFSF